MRDRGTQMQRDLPVAHQLLRRRVNATPRSTIPPTTKP